MRAVLPARAWQARSCSPTYASVSTIRPSIHPFRTRPSYLATACGDDEALRQEVELLLTSHQRAKSFLETPAAVLFDEPMVTKSLEGQRIGMHVTRLIRGAVRAGVDA